VHVCLHANGSHCHPAAGLPAEGSSERIPWDSQWPLLAGIQVGAWVLAAAIMGDYRGQYRDQSGE
jgi:hypothetical protein